MLSEKARRAAPSPRMYEMRGTVLGLPVDVLGMDALLDTMATWIDESHAFHESHATDTTAHALHTVEGSTPQATRQIVTLNPEMAMAARRDSALAAAIRGADLVTADGVGVVWALRLCGVRAVRRLTGVDLLEAFAALAARRGYRVFLLGAAPGVADAAAARLAERYRGLTVAGTYAGSPRPADEPDAVDRVRAARPDAVFVAFGSPAQENWIAGNRARLGAAVAVGVGGAFDFLAGRVPRAPEPLRRLGLEWLYRLWREPWRWRRMLALPRFAVAVIGERVRARKRKRTMEESCGSGRSER